MKQTEIAWHPIVQELLDYGIAPFDGKYHPVSAGNPVVNPGGQEWVKARWIFLPHTDRAGYWEVYGGGAYMGAKFWFNLPTAPAKAKHSKHTEYLG